MLNLMIMVSVKDRRMKVVTLRCDSPDDLYPLGPTTEPKHHHTLTAVSRGTWHRRLGHLVDDALDQTLRRSSLAITESSCPTCHACQSGKSVRLPFSSSDHVSYFQFQLPGFQYYRYR